MPQITVMYWNIQNFGNTPLYKTAYPPLCDLIATVAGLVGADVICIQELKQNAIGNQYLQLLQRTLQALPAPQNNWYYEWIKGSVASTGVAPFATSADLAWDAAHYEGYAMFWNQNVAKFRMNGAPPIQAPAGGAAVANTQAETVRTRMLVAFGGVPVMIEGIAVPPGGIVVPPDPAYTLPAGTTAPGGAPINDAGGGVLVPAGGVLGAPVNCNSATVLPVGTLVGPAGVTLSVQTHNLPVVVVPGNFTLTDPLALPAVAATLVPEHALSLVLTGRDTRGGGLNPSSWTGNISGSTAVFNPAAAHPWQYLYFTRGAGQPAGMKGARRPAYVTLDVNIPGGAPAARLTPVIMYHAPSASPAAGGGMQRAAYSRPVYQAYDPVAAAWINNTRAVLGGDVNVVVDSVQYAQDAFTDTFAAGGANCAVGIYNPPPMGGTRGDNPLNRSTVQINNPPVAGVPILAVNPDAYRRLAIDNVYYRGFAMGTANSWIFDLMQAVTGAYAPGVIPAPVLQQFVQQITVLQQNLAVLTGAAPPPAPVLPGVQDAADLVVNLALGAFVWPNANPPARPAAEFLHMCASDHLPVVFQMNL